MLVAEYAQLQERTEAIENVNREGGKYIRDAKVSRVVLVTADSSYWQLSLVWYLANSTSVMPRSRDFMVTADLLTVGFDRLADSTDDEQ